METTQISAFGQGPELSPRNADAQSDTIVLERGDEFVADECDQSRATDAPYEKNCHGERPVPAHRSEIGEHRGDTHAAGHKYRDG